MRNTNIRGELKMEEIKNQTDRHKLRLFGHVPRMDGHGIPKKLLEIKKSKKIPRGRPCTLWIDQVKSNVGQDETGGWYIKCKNGQTKTGGDSCTKTDPQVWKQLKEGGGLPCYVA
jgi:hypothetical protein